MGREKLPGWLHKAEDSDRRLSQLVTMMARRTWARRLLILGAHLGDSWVWLAGSGLGLAFGEPAIRRLVLCLGLAVLVSVGAGSLIKFVVRRPRPQQLTGFYSRRLDLYSFPSGHSARVAAIALMMSFLYPQGAVIFAGYALIVGFSRVALGIHYVGDVLAGFILGGGVSLLIVLWFL